MNSPRGLEAYGRVLHEYEGEGRLCFRDGGEQACRFAAGQLASGRVLLLCESEDVELAISLMRASEQREPSQFTGTSRNGARVTVQGHLHTRTWLPGLSGGSSIAFGADELQVEEREGTPAGEVETRFGVTNIDFVGTHPHTDGQRWVRSLPVPMIGLDEGSSAHLVPIRGYHDVVKRLKELKSIEVTSDVVIPSSARWPTGELEQWVTGLCYVLSVARGTKIQWLFREERDVSGSLIRRKHSHRVAKPYTGWHTIDLGLTARAATEQFLATALRCYADLRGAFRLDRGTIDNYLDARLEEDFVELRAVKLAVAIEALQAVFLEQPSERTLAHVVDPAWFDRELAPRIQQAIARALHEAGVSREEAAKIASPAKLGTLNRSSLRRVFRRLCRHFDLEVDERDLELFLASRNKLVHTGRFYCQAATEEEQRRLPPLESVAAEFTFLVYFLDRIFLKLLGYSGSFIDWREHVRAARRGD